jgi:hypothetical protein
MVWRRSLVDDDFKKLEADLKDLAQVSPRKARQVVQQAGIRTKQEWQKDAAGNPFHKRYTATIDYEITGSVKDGEITLDVGPDIKRYGGKTGRGGLVPSAGIFDDPRRDGGISVTPDRARVRAEKFAADDVEKGIDIAIGQLLKEHGL